MHFLPNISPKNGWNSNPQPPDQITVALPPELQGQTGTGAGCE